MGNEVKPSYVKIEDLFGQQGYVDSNGVPILQQRFAKCPNSTYQARYVQALYNDSRQVADFVINATGLKELSANRKAIFSNFAWIREQLANQGWDPLKDGITVSDAYLLSSIVNALPSFFIHHPDYRYPRTEIPVAIAHMYRANAGIYSALSYMMNEEDESADELIANAAEVYHFADQKGNLLNDGTREVCAAPPELIVRTIDALLFGKDVNLEEANIADLFKSQVDIGIFFMFASAHSLATHVGSELRSFSRRREMLPKIISEKYPDFPSDVLASKLAELDESILLAMGDAINAEAYMNDILRGNGFHESSEKYLKNPIVW